MPSGLDRVPLMMTPKPMALVRPHVDQKHGLSVDVVNVPGWANQIIIIDGFTLNAT